MIDDRYRNIQYHVRGSHACVIYTSEGLDIVFIELVNRELTWTQEGSEAVKDFRVFLSPGEAHDRADVQRKRAYLLPRRQVEHL